MRKRFLVIPGWVISSNDGERHYISFGQLVQLYKVPPSECIDASDDRLRQLSRARGISDRGDDGLRRLRPRYDGNYAL